MKTSNNNNAKQKELIGAEVKFTGSKIKGLIEKVEGNFFHVRTDNGKFVSHADDIQLCLKKGRMAILYGYLSGNTVYKRAYKRAELSQMILNA